MGSSASVASVVGAGWVYAESQKLRVEGQVFGLRVEGLGFGVWGVRV